MGDGLGPRYESFLAMYLCREEKWRVTEKAGFDVFITLDQGIEYEQNLGGRSLDVILIRAKSSRLEDLLPHAAEILAVLEFIEVGQLVHVR